MNLLRYSKIILSLLVIFIAGGFVGYEISDRKDHQRHRRAPWEKKDFSERRLEWMTEKLDLTPAQIAKIKPILEDADKELKTIHDETYERTFEVIRRSDERASKELTEEQRTLLEEIHRKHKERIRQWKGKEKGDRGKESPQAFAPPCFRECAEREDSDETVGDATKVRLPFWKFNEPNI